MGGEIKGQQERQEDPSRLVRIHAMPGRFLHHCPACGGDVLESIEHVLLECPRWEYHRRNFGALV
jgi:hypothetical protein